MASARSSDGLGFVYCGDHGDERVDLGELEELSDARVGPSGNEADAFATAADVMTDEHAYARGVHVWNCGEVEDIRDGLGVAWGQFAIEDVVESGGCHGAK